MKLLVRSAEGHYLMETTDDPLGMAVRLYEATADWWTEVEFVVAPDDHASCVRWPERWR